jgi:hypothetical protein
MLNTIGAPTDGSKRNDSIGYGIVRPRIALQNPGDPGPADVYPLPDLKAAENAAASPSASAPDSQGAGAPAKDDDSNATAAKDSGNNTLWIALAVGAAVLLAAAVAAVAMARKRRSRATPPPPPGIPMQHAPYGGWQSQQGPGGTSPQGSNPYDQGRPY